MLKPAVDRGKANELMDLNTILENVKQNLKIAIEESSAVIVSQPLPQIEGQRAHFVQLFQNLIRNAIKYRGEQAPRILISAEPLDNAWRFVVADNGMGISPEYHSYIFGVFKRLHGQTISGTGMGLAICQRVVERYNGRIWVESKPGEGAKFYFTIREGGTKTMSNGPDAKAFQILLVEDNAADIYLFRQALVRAGLTFESDGD